MTPVPRPQHSPIHLSLEPSLKGGSNSPFIKKKLKTQVPMARTRSAKKATRCKSSLQNKRSDPDLDLISNLPADAYNAILICLPLRDAVRTSILSRKWRYRWASIPRLVFDGINRGAMDLEDIVNGVLLVHDGPVHKFDYSYEVKSTYHLDRWILFLSKNGIKQLTLSYVDCFEYIVHSSLFSCQALTDLHLSDCTINPPPAFEGFRGLKNLYLRDLRIANDELERLILKCPLLETLTLLDLDSCLDHFVINALNLRHLCLSGYIFDLQINNSPLLITATINLTGMDDAKHLEQGGVCNLNKILGNLHHIEKLELQGCLLELLSVGNVPDVLPTSFLHLKNLSMDISFNDPKVVLTTLCMLRSSPNLEKLQLFVLDYYSLEFQVTPLTVFWEAQEQLDCLLNHLRTVMMSGIVGRESELCFMRFLLANAPVLETMNTGHALKKSRFLKDMLQLRRASNRIGKY